MALGQLTFAWPAAFWGLLVLVPLVVIYVFRATFRSQPVSSLHFWAGKLPPLAGGRRRERPRLPVLFWLELAVLLLVVAAAAAPRLPGTQALRPLIVVLDDSFSMRAGGLESAREKAVAALSKDFQQVPFSVVRFVAAGIEPAVLGDPARSPGSALERLQEWRCLSPGCALTEAIAFAADLAGERGRLLVITDHPPVQTPEGGRLRWIACGSPRANAGFVNALRTRIDDQEVALFEIANLGTETRHVKLTLEHDGSIEAKEIEIGAGGTRRIPLELGKTCGTLTARLDDDSLLLDNSAVLLPLREAPIPCALKIGDPGLAAGVRRALEAAGHAETQAPVPSIVFTDDPVAPDPQGGKWLVRFVAEASAGSGEGLVGPFLIDRGHPLTEGLSLQGVVWGVGGRGVLPGVPVITAGNVSLLTDRERAGGRELTVRLRPQLSNLAASVDWPIFFCNLLAWRRLEEPGPDRRNLSLGADLLLRLPPSAATVTLVEPDGSRRSMAPGGDRLSLRLTNPGVHQIEAAPRIWSVAVNAGSPSESDLRHADRGEWGTWQSGGSGEIEEVNVAWLFLLPALLLLAAHAALQSAGRPGGER